MEGDLGMEGAKSISERLHKSSEVAATTTPPDPFISPATVICNGDTMRKTPTGREMIRMLARKGFRIMRKSRGSHFTLMDIDGKRPTTVQNTNKEPSKGVLRSISKQSGIPLKELLAGYAISISTFIHIYRIGTHCICCHGHKISSWYSGFRMGYV